MFQKASFDKEANLPPLDAPATKRLKKKPNIPQIKQLLLFFEFSHPVSVSKSAEAKIIVILQNNKKAASPLAKRKKMCLSQTPVNSNAHKIEVPDTSFAFQVKYLMENYGVLSAQKHVYAKAITINMRRVPNQLPPPAR